MNIVEVSFWVAGPIMLLLAWIAGYLEGKAEPSDAAALLIAGRLIERGEANNYMSPGQMATILLPGTTRAMNLASNVLKLMILGSAIVTTWWLWFPAVFVRLVSSLLTENLWANSSLDHNCFWIAGDLQRRKANYLAKQDLERAETAERLLDDVSLIWEECKESDEQVPRRSEVAKQLGVRRSL